jgi:hypothetical protein
MPIPDFQSMMLPLLLAIADNAEHKNRDVAGALAKQFGLTDHELEEMLPSGAQTVYTNRVAWAKAYLKKSGLLESPSRGTLRITDLGRQTLAGIGRRVRAGKAMGGNDGRPARGPGVCRKHGRVSSEEGRTHNDVNLFQGRSRIRQPNRAPNRIDRR